MVEGRSAAKYRSKYGINQDTVIEVRSGELLGERPLVLLAAVREDVVQQREELMLLEHSRMIGVKEGEEGVNDVW